MPNQRFLPPAKPGEAYPIGSGPRFNGTNHTFLDELSGFMEAQDAQTSPRRPTPFSVVWQFSSDLAGDSGPALERKARRSLRGLLALLALRSRCGLVLEYKVSKPFDEAAAQYPVVEMFRRHFPYQPPRLFRGHQLIYLALGGQVIAGYSPLTLLFPAARQFQFPDGSKPVWFSEKLGEWLDPTVAGPQVPGSEEQVPEEFIESHAGAIRSWLDFASEWLNTANPAVVTTIPDANLLSNELVRWRKELERYTPEGKIVAAPIRVSGEPGKEADALLQAAEPLSFAAEGAPPTDLVFRNGRYLLSRTLLGDSGKRLYGSTTGGSHLSALWDSAPVSGADLGQALDLPARDRNSLPLPFVFVDKLFTPGLASIARTSGSGSESEISLSPGWDALALNRVLYAYPFTTEVFEHFSPEELSKAVTITDSKLVPKGISIKFWIDGFEHEKIYQQDGPPVAPVEILDQSLDLRLFPDYDMSAIGGKDRERQLPMELDRCYFVRVRLSEALVPVEFFPLLEKEGKITRAGEGEVESSKTGSLNALPDGFGPGVRLTQKIRPNGHRLSGFELEGKGLILLSLQKPVHPQGGTLEPKTVGIDFGTSNTCLSMILGHGNDQVLIPDATTTSLLASFVPGPRKSSHEGFAAMFDFFYADPRKGKKGGKLYENSFFPTQLVSRTAFQKEGFRPGEGFDPRAALICFHSLSDLLRGGTAMLNSVDCYVPPKKKGEHRDFEPQIHLRDRLKWDYTDESEAGLFRQLRRIFHGHLRLQLVHAVARSGGYIANVRASYPKAFTEIQKNRYEEELHGIWSNSAATSKPAVRTYTESHAAAAFLTPEDRVDHFMIDIGGGTTDICIFSDGALQMESSVKMAADVMDRFVMSAASEPLRNKLFQSYRVRSENSAASSVLSSDLLEELGKRFVQKEGLADDHDDRHFEGAITQRGVFYAVLALAKSLEPSEFRLICDELSDAKNFNNPRVEQFFTTLAVFFGGLAYFSGLMLRRKLRDTGSAFAGQEDSAMEGRRVVISFAGNGSNHLAWLRSGNEAATDAFLTAMFRSGSGLGTDKSVKILMDEDPKAVVARGLLRVPENNLETATRQIYDHLEGEWMEGGVSDLMGFYRSEGSPSGKWIYEKSELRKLLAALSAAAPKGTVGKRKISSLGEGSWAESLVSSSHIRNDLMQVLGHRLSKCKAAFKDEIKAGQGDLALEPVLIAELCGLFSVIRKEQASGNHAQ